MAADAVPKSFENAPAVAAITPGTATVDDLFNCMDIMREVYEGRVDGFWMSKERALAFGAVGFIVHALPSMVITDFPVDAIGVQGSSKGKTIWLLLEI